MGKPCAPLCPKMVRHPTIRFGTIGQIPAIPSAFTHQVILGSFFDVPLSMGCPESAFASEPVCSGEGALVRST